MTKYERFMAGEAFTHPLLGTDAHHRFITKNSTSDLGAICQTVIFGAHVGNIEKITRTRVFIYSYWLRKRLTAKLFFDAMEFDIDLDSTGRVIKKQ